MRIIGLSLIILAVLATGFMIGCSPEQDAAIKEKSDIGAFSSALKAKDLAIKGAVQGTLGDPLPLFYGIKCTVSHDVITLMGTVKTEKQKKDIYDLVLRIDDHRVKEENIINEIQVDPSLDDLPFEW